MIFPTVGTAVMEALISAMVGDVVEGRRCPEGRIDWDDGVVIAEGMVGLVVATSVGSLVSTRAGIDEGDVEGLAVEGVAVVGSSVSVAPIVGELVVGATVVGAVVG